MPTHDAWWTENRPGGAEDPRNLMSFPVDGKIYKSTRKVLPWSLTGAADPNRANLPSAHIERWFKYAKVKNPADLHEPDDRFLVKCLGIGEYMDDALEMLIEQGCFEIQGDDGEWEIYVYDELDELNEEADTVVKRMPDAPEFLVTEHSWEWLHNFDDTAGEQGHKWLYSLSLGALTKHTGTLELYVDLMLIVGPRSTKTVRTQTDSTFYNMVAAGTGGQVIAGVKKYYYPGDAGAVPMEVSYLAMQLPQFLFSTRYPLPYRVEHTNLEDYARDAVWRACWKTATRQEWTVFAQDKIRFALRNRLPTMGDIYHDFKGEAPALVDSVQGLGDAVLKGENAKYPLRNIEEIESALALDYGEMITGMRNDGESSEVILAKVLDMLKVAHPKSKVGEGTDEPVRGPKPGQVARALADKEYARVEGAGLAILKNPMATVKEKLAVIRNAFEAQTVLPKAVLFAAKGHRMAVYIGQDGADYLALLHDDRRLLAQFFGQSLAYDEEEGMVPTDLETFMLDETELEHLLNLQWAKMDPFNNCVLKLRGALGNAHFPKYQTASVYHDADTIEHVTNSHGKLFSAVGYPDKVAEEEGWSYSQFMTQIKRLQRHGTSLATEEQARCWSTIDSFIERGYTAAAKQFDHVVYGGCPSGKTLRAWVTSEEPLVIEMRKMMGQLKEFLTFKRNMGGLFVTKTVAATLPNHSVASGSGVVKTGGGANQQRRSKKERAAERSAARKQAKGKDKAADATPSASGGGGGDGGKRPTQPKTLGSMVDEKRIFMYADGNFSLGERTPAAAPPRFTPPRARATARHQAEPARQPSQGHCTLPSLGTRA